MSNESIGWWHTPPTRAIPIHHEISGRTTPQPIGYVSIPADITLEQIRQMIREEVRNALQELDEQLEPHIVTITQESDKA